MQIALSLSALLLYTLFLFHRPATQNKKGLFALFVCATALHCASILSSVYQPIWNWNIGNVLSSVCLFSFILGTIGNYCLQITQHGRYLSLLPIVGILFNLPFLAPHILANPDHPLLKIHLLIALLAYACFAIATLFAGLITSQERHLHQSPLPIHETRPALLTLEKWLFRLISYGLILLSITILSGILFSEQIFGKALFFSHKTLFAMISWLIYATLLMGRWQYGWRGKTAMRYILAGFIALFLTYFGSQFVLEVVLHKNI